MVHHTIAINILRNGSNLIHFDFFFHIKVGILLLQFVSFFIDSSISKASSKNMQLKLPYFKPHLHFKLQIAICSL